MFSRFVLFALVAFSSVSGVVAQQDGQPHLYFFTNPGCGPCKQVEPEIHLLIGKGYPVSIIDTTRQPDVAQRFNVDRTPTTILVADNRIAGRKAGLVSALTIVDWFNAANASRATSVSVAQPKQQVQTAPIRRQRGANLDADASQISSTVHNGTRKPNSQAEYAAMQATVRLHVKDSGGSSSATGTVIHCQDGECLVLTCGHVFRESGGNCEVVGELGFESNEIKRFPGKLVSYDADSRDVALVILKTGFDVPAVRVAPNSFPVSIGDQVFTLGCDHAEDATIRRTRIKRQAMYATNERPNEKAKKYEIYGRPVVGRSGGGLFTAGGQLIGVGNAAAVEVDEGIYTSLDNIYWQLAQVNLSHLFEVDQAVVRNGNRSPDRLQGLQASTPRNVQPLRGNRFNPNPPITQVEQFVPDPIPAEDTQIIVVLQSKSAPGEAETLVINHPSRELIERLRSSGGDSSSNPADRMAQLRREMPLVNAPRSSNGVRAQSPR